MDPSYIPRIHLSHGCSHDWRICVTSIEPLHSRTHHTHATHPEYWCHQLLLHQALSQDSSQPGDHQCREQSSKKCVYYQVSIGWHAHWHLLRVWGCRSSEIKAEFSQWSIPFLNLRYHHLI